MDIEQIHKCISGATTFLIMAIAILICAFCGLNPPDPPIPEEGVEVNLGNSDFGLGDNANPDVSEEMRPATTSPSNAGERVSTQSTEQTVSVNATKNPSTKPTNQTVTKPLEDTKPVEKTEPQINKNALFPGKRTTNNSGSQGVTQGTGDQGKQGGNPNSQRYDGVPGNGGSGWSLEGRSASSIPKPQYNNTKEGKIIVRIWVNRAGQVTKVEAPIKGSTIADNMLVERAKNAAKQAKFNADNNAAEEQVGTITYVFRNNN